MPDANLQRDCSCRPTKAAVPEEIALQRGHGAATVPENYHQRQRPIGKPLRSPGVRNARAKWRSHGETRAVVMMAV